MPDIKNLLLNAKKPVGTTMYVYGGGWNKEDTGAGKEAVTIGLSPLWQEFAKKQDSSYNFKDYNYCNNLGLDCSGYVGWVIYNTLNNISGEAGYVFKSTKVAEKLQSLGLGKLNNIIDYKPGDILSSNCNCCNHVWIAIGQCEDESVVFFHSSPCGVMLSGTTTFDNKKSKAIEMAEYYMKTYYPDWYMRFPDISRDNTYLTHYVQFRWDRNILSDTNNYYNMPVKKILKDLFNA